MKVLYIGCYREGTGWGQAAIDYILSMDAAGINVVPRAVKLNERQIELPKRILELEAQDSSGCDVCIQHVLPHLMEYSPKVKNIALYATETSNFSSSSWPRKINCMDEAWVINEQMVRASEDSGVTIPIHVVPHATNFSKFESSHKKLSLTDANNFTFYFIGDLNRRKNIEAFVQAFHSEFHKNEPVSILIKTNKHGLNPDQCAKEVRNICNIVKSGLKIYVDVNDYKEDLIITDYISEEDIYSIHSSCDCFVMPSYGEAWCIPAFDAMGFGKTPICTDVGGMRDFIEHAVVDPKTLQRSWTRGGILVSGRLEPVSGMTETFQDIFTAREDWVSINIKELQHTMRQVYEWHKESNPEYSSMKQKGLLQAFEYSHQKIGTKIKELLNG